MNSTRLGFYLLSLVLAGYVIWAEVSYTGASPIRPELIALAVSVALQALLQIYSPAGQIWTEQQNAKNRK